LLPINNTPWINEEMAEQYKEYAIYDAWYSGDPARIANLYSGMLYPLHTTAGKFFEDEYYDYVNSRSFFWGKKIVEERRSMIHIPIASDIARLSADLLFSEPPKAIIHEANEENATKEMIATQMRLDEIMQLSEVQSLLLESAETASALGGVFLKVNWDSDIANYPILSIAQPDTAVPSFQWGILKSCSFWKVVREEGAGYNEVYYRLFEHHEVGKIIYALYKGTDDNIGMRISLQAIPETAMLQDEIATGIDDLLVRYIPNIKPNRKHRGSPFGQSDLSGIEALMDALDEVYSSLQRDIRLGQARIMIPESFVQKLPNGEMVFDIDKEVFTMFDIDPLTSKEVGITMSQFEIRTEQHINTCLEYIHRIISSAGYSPQSFGLSIEGNQSGTALNIRERQSFITTAKKQRYWKSAIEDLLYLMLQVDKIHFNSKITPTKPHIEFGDSVASDVSQMASSIDLLSRAKAISIESSVRWTNPDWSNEQVMQEVERIKEENGLSMSSPFQNGDLV
jgi:A118 family predicted phage portal protein